MADDGTVSIKIAGEVDASLTSSTAAAKSSLADLATAGNAAADALDGGLKEGFLNSALAATRMAGEVAGLGEKLNSQNFIEAASDIAGIATSFAELGPAALGPAAAIGAVAGGLGSLVYQSLATQNDMAGLAEGFALTGRAAVGSAAAAKAEIDALSDLPGVTSAVAQAIVQWEAAHGEISAQINNAVDQLLPQYVQWLGDKAPEAVGRLKEQLQIIASGSLPDASRAFGELNASLNLQPKIAANIEAMIVASNRTGAWTAALLDLAANGGGHISSLKAQIADTSAELTQAKSSADVLKGAMESGWGASRQEAAIQAMNWARADEEVQNLTAHLNSLRATLATSTVVPQIPMSNLDRYTQILQRNTILAGETAANRAVDSALIDAATAKLRDEGEAEKQVVTTARQARDILGSQAGVIAKIAAAGAKPAASGDAGNDAAKAKEQADQIIAINKQLQEAIIEGAKQTNTAQLALGQESLGQYTEQALSQANAKYDAAVQGYEREAATGKLMHAEMLAELALADQQWSNEVNAIWEQTAEKQRATDEKGFADYQKQLDERVKATEDANQRMYESGQMTAQQKVAADLAALDASKGADDQHFAQLTANRNTESEAYKTELEKRNDFDKQYNEQRRTLETQSANDAVAQWRTTDQQILSAESSLVSDIFSKRRGLGADLREIGLKTLEDEITNDLKMLTEHEMVNLGMMKSDQASSQGGLIFKLGQYALDKAGILSTETAKVVSVAAGQASQNAAVASGEAAGKAVSLTAAETEIATNAAVAASGAMAAIAMIPYVGPIMAPAAAAATYAETMAYAGLASAEGGQLQVPFDGQLTELHRNEMVLPASVAGPMRDHFAGAPNGDVAGGGGDMHTHFNLSTLGARDLESMVRNNMSMFMKIAKNHARNSVGRR